MKYQRIRKPIVIATAALFHLLLLFHLIFSPVIIILAANQGLVNASFITFILIFLFSLFFGRAYCAWFCPGCGVQEITSFFIKRKSKNSNAVYLKYIIFTLLIGFIIILYILRGIHQIDLSYGMNNITVTRKLILTLGAIAIIVPLTIVFGRFASCKYICWQAPLMILGTKLRDLLKIPGLRLKFDEKNCKSCNACMHQCPMNIDLLTELKRGNMRNPECILCGSCIDACKHKALSFQFTINSRLNTPDTIPERDVNL
jgi:polyferredoxin